MNIILKKLLFGIAPLCLFIAATTGCGTLKQRSATDQILLSSAIDHSIANVDFRYLAGKKVFLDTTYLKLTPSKTPGFDNTAYIIGSIRQQLFAADVRLEDDKKTADVILEARVGGLGADGHVVSYGIPASNILASAASLLPNKPPIPAIPEISVAKKDNYSATAKFVFFAYYKESRRPVWQSGKSLKKETSRDFYVLGAGPFQSGTIHEGTTFAGTKIGFSLIDKEEEEQRPSRVPYDHAYVFEHEKKPLPKRMIAKSVVTPTSVKEPGKTVVSPASTKKKPEATKPPKSPQVTAAAAKPKPAAKAKPTPEKVATAKPANPPVKPASVDLTKKTLASITLKATVQDEKSKTTPSGGSTTDAAPAPSSSDVNPAAHVASLRVEKSVLVKR